MGNQSDRSPSFGNCMTPDLESREKHHLCVAPVENHKK